MKWRRPYSIYKLPAGARQARSMHESAPRVRPATASADWIDGEVDSAEERGGFCTRCTSAE
jgi:hypothetical protein